MNVLAIYAVNQHLADLQDEARRRRLADMVDKRPSLLGRLLAAVRFPLGAGPAGPSSTAASAA
jgi:hypothetical protein